MRLSVPRLTLRGRVLHPSPRRLEQFHQQAPGDRDERIARHVTGCRDCREWMRWRAALGDATTALRADSAQAPVPAPETPLARALERRAAGERVLLPPEQVGDDVRPRLRRPPLWLAAAACLVVAVVVASRTGRVAMAGDVEGSLALSPASPRAGDTIAVTYRPNAALAGAPRLRLRAVFHPGDDVKPWARPAVTAAWLARDGDGLYRGRFVLPRKAAYARFAVEDADGTKVDAHGHLPWDVIARDASGRPRMDGIRSQGIGAGPGEWERSRAIAVMATRLHPDHPSGWMMVTQQDLQLAGQSGAPGVLAAARTRVARLDGAMARQATHEPWAMLDLSALAGMTGDAAAAERWQSRLLAEAPRSRAGYSVRFTSLAGPAAGPRAPLDSLDAWWRIDPDSVMLFAGAALSTALRVGDTAAAARWAARVVADDSLAALPIARALVANAALAATGVSLARLAESRARTASDAARPLDADAGEWQRRRAADVRAALAVQGEGLLALGRAPEAVRALAAAAAAGWDGRAFRLLGDARLQSGDTAGALAAFSHAAADPIEGARLMQALPARLGAAVQGPAWAAAVAAARYTMHARVAGQTTVETVRGDPRLWDEAGTRRSLSQIAGGRVTVVALVSRRCGPSLQDLPNVERLYRALSARPVAFVAVTREEPGDSLRAFLRAGGYTIPVWHDREGEAAAMLSAHGTPAYLVLDGRGRVRWRGHRIADASPVVDALVALQAGDGAKGGGSSAAPRHP
jgi:hypothetical protein